VRPQSLGRGIYALALSQFLLVGVSGCVATRGWVQEQITPLSRQVMEVDTRVRQTEAKTDGAMGRIAEIDAQLNQTKSQAELAFKNLENLRLEQRFVLGVHEGATFALGSSNLTADAQRAIDTFLHTLNGTNEVTFFVVGHTDNTGSEDYNEALGQRRAASVARYLITQKGVNPLRVTAVSYGERAPLANNSTPQGRRKNRRVEIQVYKEMIASTPSGRRLELERVSGR
jgi:outer membrane protein OmpA-like peptidoglycan-associated protein